MFQKNFLNTFFKSLTYLLIFCSVCSLYNFFKNSTSLILLITCYITLIICNKLLEPLYLAISSKLSKLNLSYIVFKFFVIYKYNESWHIDFKKPTSLLLAKKYNYNLPLCNSKNSISKLKKSINSMFLNFLLISSIPLILYSYTIINFTNETAFLLPAILNISFNLLMVFPKANNALRLFGNNLNILSLCTNTTIKYNKYNCYSSNQLLNSLKNLSLCKSEKEIISQLIILENLLKLKLYNLIEAIPSSFYDNIKYLLINEEKFLNNNYIEYSSKTYYLICIYLHHIENKSFTASELFTKINSKYFCKFPNDNILKNKVAYILGFKHDLEYILNSYVFDLVDNKNKERVYIENFRKDLTLALV